MVSLSALAKMGGTSASPPFTLFFTTCRHNNIPVVILLDHISIAVIRCDELISYLKTVSWDSVSYSFDSGFEYDGLTAS